MSKQAAFKEGSIVKLKSGGPGMTVQEAFADGDNRCQWFAGKKLESGIFPAVSLELVEPESK